MVYRTKEEADLIDDFMQPAYNDAFRGAAVLRMFMQSYDFDMREPQEHSLNDLKLQWEMAGQVLYSVLGYLDSASDKLGEVLFENSSPEQ